MGIEHENEEMELAILQKENEPKDKLLAKCNSN